MRKIYWNLNKWGVLSYLLTAVIFVAATIFFIGTMETVAKVDVELVGAMRVMSSSIIFGASSLAMLIVYLYIMVKPFFQKHFELLVQVGESIIIYTAIHFIVMVVITFIPDLLIKSAVEMLLNDTPAYADLVAAMDIQSQVKTILGAIATVAWTMTIPLAIYNDKIFHNMGSKPRLWLIIVIVLVVWFGLSGVVTVTSAMEGFKYGISLVENNDSNFITGLEMAVNTPGITSLMPILLDVLGIGVFIAAFIGFMKNYTVRR